MSLVDVDQAVTFTVNPPQSVMDLVMYEDARVNVARLNGHQRHALAWALSMHHDPMPVHRPAELAAPPPARRKVGLLEVLRGRVECCDPAVVRVWQRFRLQTVLYLLLCAPLVWHIMTLANRWVLLGVMLVACALSWGALFGMNRSKASVCH